MTREDMLKFVLTSLEDDKAEDIVTIDLSGKSTIADYMVVATGRSTRQVAAIAEKLRDRLAKEGVKAKIEGLPNADWALLDAGDIIVHVFRPEVRDFYDIEKIWGVDYAGVENTLYISA